MKIALRWLCAVMLLATYASAQADEFRPAYLQLTQVDTRTYDVLWKVPALDETTSLKGKPTFPAGTTTLGSIHRSYVNGSAIQRWRITVANGLDGKSITFGELAISRTDVLVRLARLDGTTQLGRILSLDPQFTIKSSPGSWEVVQTYTVLGISHILTGFDHLLFVLALLLLVNNKRKLVITVTAFTLAHSVTLAFATLGMIHVPSPPVEALIALSIVFVAAEIIHARSGQPGLSQRYPWIVAFAFGLLHGLGFAGALAEVGLPPLSIPIALLFFNVGVEIGQLMFIAAVFGLIAIATRLNTRVNKPLPIWAWRVPPYAIGGMASYWVIERVTGLI